MFSAALKTLLLLILYLLFQQDLFVQNSLILHFPPLPVRISLLFWDKDIFKCSHIQKYWVLGLEHPMWIWGVYSTAYNKEHRRLGLFWISILVWVWGYWRNNLFSLVLYSHHSGKYGPTLGWAFLNWGVTNNISGESSGQAPSVNSMKWIISNFFPALKHDG